MSVSVADLVWERVGEPLDQATPTIGVTAIRQALEDLLLHLEAGIVEIRDACFTGLRAGSLTYSGTVQIEGAPQALGTLGPRSLALPNGRLDLQPGWPIRHSSPRSPGDWPGSS